MQTVDPKSDSLTLKNTALRDAQGRNFWNESRRKVRLPVLHRLSFSVTEWNCRIENAFYAVPNGAAGDRLANALQLSGKKQILGLRIKEGYAILNLIKTIQIARKKTSFFVADRSFYVTNAEEDKT